MPRWLKLLLLALVIAGAGLVSLPWWLGAALRPVLKAHEVTFGRYERVGYAHFRLHDVRFAHAGFNLTAGQVQLLTPLAWLAQRLRGAEPALLVTDWRVERSGETGGRDYQSREAVASPTATRGTDSPASKQSDPATTESGSSDQPLIAGLADLQATLQRFGPRVGTWLPRAHLKSGVLHGFGPEVTIASADWRKATLTVEGVQVAGQVIAFVLAPATDGTVVLNAHTAGHAARLRLVWSGADLKGEAVLWEQTAQLSAHFPANGWLPAEASAVAENWKLPAARVKLGVPYAQVLGTARLLWRDGAFDLSVTARAEPAADAKKAPPFAASATAHGNLRELTLTALSVDAPFATARLSAPITFSLDHPLAGASAQLSVQADLAKIPWIEASGRAVGTVAVTGQDAAATQDFALEFTDVVLPGFALKKAQARGRLQWPQLALTKLTVQLDATSSLEAHGAVNWETRELAGVALKAELTPAWFARWLPAGAGWTTAELTATAEGPLGAPRTQGSLKLGAVLWAPLHAIDLDASWQGAGAKTEITATAKAGNSALVFAGTVNPSGLLLTKLQFVPAGKPAWELAAPAQLTRAPVWQINPLQLTGSASQLTFKGKGGPEGAFALEASGFDSAWLQDWITLTGPAWSLHSLKTTGRFAGGALVFDTQLTAQIAMAPRPAEVKLVASGDAQGVQLKEFSVIESARVLTQATGRLPLVWTLDSGLRLDDTAPLEVSASTEPDSPLWAALAVFTGVELTKPAAKIELKGSVRQPSGELQVQAAAVSAAPERFKFSPPELADVTLAVQFDRTAVKFTSFSGKVDGQAVTASGQLPMNDGDWQQLWRQPAAFDWGKAAARVEIPGADLAPLARRFPQFVAAQGNLRAVVELKPGGKFSGELHLKDAATRPLPPFGTLQEIQADLVLADHTITVGQLTARIGGEPVAVEGNVTLGPDAAPHLALSLKGRNLPLVRNTGLLLRADFDLTASTDATGRTQLAGAAVVRDCLLLASLNLRSLLPNGVRGVARPPPYFSVATAPFSSWSLAVEVQAVKSVRLRTTVFNGTASGRFRLDGTLGEPRAIGELTMDEGRVLFPFATFKVQNGSIRLREADPFHAVVNLSATSQRRDYQLRLEATGEFPSPNILLSSTPVLDAGEVLLLVMTGQPPSGVVAGAGGQRLALLGAYLSRGLFQDLGIGGEDRLEISAGAQVSEQGRDTFEFEYKLGERSALVGEYDRFDSYNAGLKWRVYTQESLPLEKK